jgi:hypothetical protein
LIGPVALLAKIDPSVLRLVQLGVPLRGTIGGLTSRQMPQGTVVSRKVDKESPAQRAGRRKFAQAVKQYWEAMADPRQRRIHEVRARKAGQSVYHYVIGQLLKQKSPTRR